MCKGTCSQAIALARRVKILEASLRNKTQAPASIPGPPLSPIDDGTNSCHWVLHSSPALSSEKHEHGQAEYGPFSKWDSKPSVEQDATVILSPVQTNLYLNDYEGDEPGVDALSQESAVVEEVSTIFLQIYFIHLNSIELPG